MVDRVGGHGDGDLRAAESPLITCSISPLCLWPTGLYGRTTPYLSEKCVASEGLPPEPEEAIFASTTTWSLSIFDFLLLEEWGERKDRGYRHAPWRRGQARSTDLVLVQFRDGVDELLEHLWRGVLEPVPGLVVGRVLQAEVGAQVDHLHPGLDELREELHGLAVRKGREDEVRTSRDLREVVPDELHVSHPPQVRVDSE